METVFSNGVQYSIEFIKLILVVVCILNIRVKRSINVIFGLSLVGIMTISYWFDVSKYSILYAFIAVIVFLIVLRQKRDIRFVVLSFVAISIIDMVFGTICINILGLNAQEIYSDNVLAVSINIISLVLIIPLSIFLYKRRDETTQKMGKIHPIIFLGGLELSIYLTYVQLVSMQDIQINYRKELIISAVGITIVCSLICYILMRNQSINRYLAMENDMNQRLIKAQNDYYTMMLKKETETKMFRHDIKQHIMCIQMLFAQKKYDELAEYLKQMDTYTKELSPKIATGNMYIDMIVADLSAEFSDVTLEWIGKVPLLSLASMDVCTLFYNLLKNSFESADKVSEKIIKVVIKKQGLHLMILVSNYYDGLRRDENDRYLSTKQEKGYGYGIKNIEKCVEKYNGSYMVTTEERLFNTEIILSNVITEE